ncbi:outer membrane protein OmpA-like peptidoglycan-associated protein [Herbaspirillum sp. Sphag1AN]|uniref:OmpA family protein n=1 Tax=unclassified Herbaspirillum TaxID=2624150 RepID=UPI0017A06F7A|nr:MULTISPECIES: OmpA family protein [unclassified Herbaspirillum]MBB3212918.1 outer membrane protein OmpA-like peptidoglycan-associated protein [Herbaspirillum sp. Sphag1AN]MBB3246115.1 outer membrane protein OmpA-like peptidoglycan-associated protein [Herbaspirillum sp. Sphag64]
MTRWNLSLLRCASLVLVTTLSTILSTTAHAQQNSADTVPTPQDIINALQVHPVTHLRSIRNLGVKRNDDSTTAVSQEPHAAGGAINLNIQFDYNSSRITVASQQILNALIVAMRSEELAQLKFRIEGHTDSTGTAEYNQKLSQQRADEVRRVLVAAHINGDRLSTEGKGASDPLNPNDTSAAENRRVRIVSVEQ